MLTSSNPQGPSEVFPGLIMAPDGGLTHFVHSSGAAGLDLLPPGMTAPSPGSFALSIAAAGALCRANRGDRIVVLPGHTETVATANPWSTMPAGVGIYGCGQVDSGQRPTINFTAAASTIVLPANTVLDNFQIDCCATAAIVVAAPITISAAGCKITRSMIHVATSATQLATLPITVATGGDDFVFENNNVWTTGAGTFATNPTQHMVITGTVKGLRIRYNDFYGGTAAATGLIQFTAAATNIRILRNSMINMFATSTSCIVGFAGLTGNISNNELSVGNNGTASAQGITVPGSTWGYNTLCADAVATSGLLTPVAST